MNIIVAVDKNWGIGKGNDLLFRISEDLKNFKRLTLGKVVVMGRKTLESLPSSKPLPNRTNIVLTSGEPSGVVIVRSLTELLEKIKDYNDNDLFVIGGEQVYTMLLPYAQRAYITHIDASAEADKHFPDLNYMKGWRVVSEGETISEGDIKFKYVEWINDEVKG